MPVLAFCAGHFTSNLSLIPVRFWEAYGNIKMTTNYSHNKCYLCEKDFSGNILLLLCSTSSLKPFFTRIHILSPFLYKHTHTHTHVSDNNRPIDSLLRRLFVSNVNYILCLLLISAPARRNNSQFRTANIHSSKEASNAIIIVILFFLLHCHTFRLLTCAFPLKCLH